MVNIAKKLRQKKTAGISQNLDIVQHLTETQKLLKEISETEKRMADREAGLLKIEKEINEKVGATLEKLSHEKKELDSKIGERSKQLEALNSELLSAKHAYKEQYKATEELNSYLASAKKEYDELLAKSKHEEEKARHHKKSHEDAEHLTVQVISNLVKRGNELVKYKQLKDTVKLYDEIRNLYKGLSEPSKKKIYDDILALYGNLNSK